LVEALPYETEDFGFEIGIFHWRNPSGNIMALEVTQPLTEMSTRNIFWEVKMTGEED
jgi:hypothetical protein